MFTESFHILNCEFNEQCIDKKFSSCKGENGSKECVCDDKYIDSTVEYNKCVLNGIFFFHYYNRCSFKIFILNLSKIFCIVDLHDECDENRFCSTSNAECHNDKCKCKQDYKEVNGKCYGGEFQIHK